MELQVGQYVRTKTGIHQIYRIDNNKTKGLATGILNTINFEDGTFMVAEDIKTIVTKEQMEAMQYIVGE